MVYLVIKKISPDSLNYQVICVFSSLFAAVRFRSKYYGCDNVHVLDNCFLDIITLPLFKFAV